MSTIQYNKLSFVAALKKVSIGGIIMKEANRTADCPACNTACPSKVGATKDHEYKTSNKNYEYYQCPICQSVVLGTYISSDELKKSYPFNYYSFHMLENYNKYKDTYWGKHFYKSIREAFLSDIQNVTKKLHKGIKDIKILDYGSGDGFRLKMYSMIGLPEGNLYGYEPYLEQNSNSSRIFLTINSIIDLGVKFDIIVASHVIEHLNNPAELFTEISKIIAKNGVVILDMPTPQGWHYQLTKSGHWGGYHAPRHLNILTPACIRNLAKKSKFEIIYMQDLDDAWIMAQTLNSMISTQSFYWIPSWVRNAFAAESKEIPTFSRSIIYGALSMFSRAIIALGGQSTNLRLVLKVA